MRHLGPEDLRQLEFFREFDDTDLVELTQEAQLHAVATGDAFFTEGEPLELGLRFVLSGELRLHKMARSGKETVLRLISAGELFGVAALFDRQVAPATAIATRPTVILEIRMANMTRYLADHPDIALRLLIVFARRLRETQDALHAVVSECARTRLARVIVQEATKDAEVVSGGLRLRSRLPHSTLSRLVGITYEECVRLLREWTLEPALLRYGRGGVITVLALERLEALAQARMPSRS